MIMSLTKIEMETMKIKITGQKVIIKPTEEEDLKHIQHLWGTAEVMKWFGYPDGLQVSVEKLAKWLAKIDKSSIRKSFVVFELSTGDFCGELFYEIDKEYKRAGLDVKFFPEAQGRGLGTESFKLLIRYIFENEPLVEAVWTIPSPSNIHAKKVYEHCGLKQSKQPVYMEHRDLYMELTRDNWKSLYTV